MLRKTALCLAIALLAGLFVGCGGDGNKDNTGSAASSGISDGIFSTEDVKFKDENGESVYRIIRPENQAMGETEKASYLFKQIKTKLEISILNSFDTEDGTDAYEILVGDTNRPESAEAKQYMYEMLGQRVDDYIICTIGKKIVINGVDGDALQKACEYFVENYVKAEGVSGGIKYLHETTGDYKDYTINGVNIGKFQLVRDNTSRSWLIQEEANKIVKLVREKAGYMYSLLEDTKTEEAEYEINIGNTVRAAKKQSDYSYDEYEILISGKKVYLMGGSTYAVQVAVTEFYNMLEKGAVTDADSKIGTYSATIANYDTSTYYRYVWGDEFDAETMDTSKWYIIPDLEYKGTHLLVSDKTLEMRDGNIIMKAYKEGDTYIECSGLESGSKFRYNMGYLEMRARVPDAKGVYSSLWGNGKDVDNRGDLLEIDIFESLGVAQRQRANVHMWYQDGSHTSLDGTTVSRDYILTEGTLFDQYRTVGFLWTDSEIHCYYDGVEYYTQETDENFLGKYLNVTAGFNVGWNDRTQPDDNTEWPLEYHIDYIRLYQLSGQSFIDNGNVIYS